MKIEKFYATQGDNTGEIDLQWEPLKGSKYYILDVCIKTKGSPRWKTIDMVSKSNYRVTGLKKSVTYQFRVASVSSKGQGQWSSEITKRI